MLDCAHMIQGEIRAIGEFKLPVSNLASLLLAATPTLPQSSPGSHTSTGTAGSSATEATLLRSWPSPPPSSRLLTSSSSAPYPPPSSWPPSMKQ